MVQADFFPFQEGDIFLIASNCAHVFRNEMHSGVEAVNVFFSTDPTKNRLMSVAEMQDLRKTYSEISPCSIIDRSISSYLDGLLSSSTANRVSIFIQMLEALKGMVQLATSKGPHLTDKTGDRIKKVMEYTFDNYREKIDVKMLARHIYYTPEAFCRFFKKKTGKTYVRYLNEYRISEVCRRLVEAEAPIVSEIAYECGFSNVSHFNRIFKEQVSCSPLEYRKNFLEKTFSLKA